MSESFQVLVKNENETEVMAAKIAANCQAGDLLILDGDLGAGKTHFVKWFVESLHAKDRVTSPTFSIANFYRTDRCNVLHIDLYRISTVNEFIDLGLDDYFGRSITLIEWGEKFSSCFDEYLLISLHVNEDNSRLITVSCKGEKYRSLTSRLTDETKGVIC
ncbi:MAG: tRNA (adenosine(37)-N6)-threonylcarbamoyltransferase complex ATPase subunit type 1 TsaE [Tannerella sp.]|jgi:tRNA threonylcarbamoyladenosine biosynthesis protein TsaE|nr:tRNA (adenosine(37)-N6)-threonylcarbamoyltransferase complex ATPase subunit type 1 TsaE [Tannerella sp.]